VQSLRTLLLEHPDNVVDTNMAFLPSVLFADALSPLANAASEPISKAGPAYDRHPIHQSQPMSTRQWINNRSDHVTSGLAH
jgi:hypothetical protein